MVDARVISAFLMMAIYILMPHQCHAMSAEDGQALFNGCFQLMMDCFCIGVVSGIAVKIINRS